MKLSIGYITAGSKPEAKEIVLDLLERELITCANIIPGAESYFMWEGEVSKASETVIIIKTRQKNEGKIIKAIRKIHSYECPCIVFTSIENGDPEFLSWIEGGC